MLMQVQIFDDTQSPILSNAVHGLHTSNNLMITGVDVVLHNPRQVRLHAMFVSGLVLHRTRIEQLILLVFQLLKLLEIRRVGIANRVVDHALAQVGGYSHHGAGD